MAAVNLKEMGARIRKQRIFLGYTQESLSEKLGVTPKFCTDLELGKKGMSLQTLCSLSSVLKVSTDYILFGKEGQSDLSEIYSMLDRCPPDKIRYAEELLRAFLSAI